MFFQPSHEPLPSTPTAPCAVYLTFTLYNSWVRVLYYGHWKRSHGSKPAIWPQLLRLPPPLPALFTGMWQPRDNFVSGRLFGLVGIGLKGLKVGRSGEASTASISIRRCLPWRHYSYGHVIHVLLYESNVPANTGQPWHTSTAKSAKYNQMYSLAR